ncbi:hypothetical protein COV18_02260 [Candidatus Woesearchaeota archaeon CG10_big_fil_rev_8_21_14_0_10_37_12]|nr:MAG: hypothetical protein COV18_02260 [Candidatus Woesearchaeota archaeon CG10_big_fil_rev_8_21_14_0_10_37_12]
MAIEVTLRKWGNSLGVILPKELVQKKHLKSDDKIFLEVVKETDLTNLFGSLKRKTSGQQFKDMAREGWE